MIKNLLLVLLLVLASAFIGGLVIIGYEGSTGTNNTGTSTTTTSTTMPVTTAQGSCIVGLSGHDTLVVFSGQSASNLCSQWISNEAQGGQNWTEIGNSSTDSTFQSTLPVTCSLQHDGNFATVNDTGMAMYGLSACSSLQASGWMQL